MATSYTDAENFRKAGANAFCITNGFDESDSSKKAGENKIHKLKKAFTLSYIGVLEQLRNPENLWKALDELVKENAEFVADFKLKFVGRIDDKILHSIENSSLKNHILNLGYLAHGKAVEEMQNSDMLLITNFPNEASKGIILEKYLNIWLQESRFYLSVRTKQMSQKFWKKRRQESISVIRIQKTLKVYS